MKLIKTSIDLDNQKDSSASVLLGTWCIKKKIDLLDQVNKYKIVPYHWNNNKKFKNDSDYLENLHERILLELSNSLNNLHGIKRNTRYWRIVIGPWLRFFTDVLFDRYETIKQSQRYKKLDYTIHKYNESDIIPEDFSEFFDYIVSDKWNEIIFSECIKYLDINYINIDSSIIFDTKKNNKKNINLKGIFKKILRLYQSIIPNHFNKIAIISTNISLIKLLKLQLLLKQLPYIIPPLIDYKIKEVDFSIRDSLNLSFSRNKFESFLSNQITKNMPKIYLESFKEYRDKSLKKYPSNPSLIYTLFGYQLEDGFKFWCAEKLFLGTKLIIGQHGGTFGISYFNQTEDHQVSIANKFISWGWKSKLYKNITPMPSINLNGNDVMSISQRNQGPFIHVLGCVPRYFYNFFSMPIAGQFSNYLKDQINFLNELNNGNLKKLKIREDVSSIKWGWNIEGVLKKNGFSDNIINSNISIQNQLKGSSLCICTHNGTVFLETLALNFPTIIFWNSSYYEIRPEAIDSIEMLKDVGILYDCPKLAAKKINNISDDVSSWWQEERIQNARSLFVRKYALNSDNSLNYLKEFLTKEANVE